MTNYPVILGTIRSQYKDPHKPIGKKVPIRHEELDCFTVRLGWKGNQLLSPKQKSSKGSEMMLVHVRYPFLISLNRLLEEK